MIEFKSKTLNIGDVYGRLTILGTYKDEGRFYARVECSCGSPAKFVRADGIRSGACKSCGCLQIESTTKHGEWNNPLFKVWKGMISRCTNQDDKRYNRYGGRGVSVCDKWLDVHQFINDMKHSYIKGMTIDRIDNNGNYEPSNCKWSTRYQQNRNYSRNIILHHNGKSMCAIDWALELNISPYTIYSRKRAGWSDALTLTKPSKKHHP